MLRLAVCENFWLSLNSGHFRVWTDGSRVSKFRVGPLFRYHLEGISIGDKRKGLCRGSEGVVFMSHLQNTGQNYHAKDLYIAKYISGNWLAQ